MIELRNDQLIFHFPEVHPKAKCIVEFERTLRIPDDGKEYPLPAGLGRFPVKHVEDFATNLPEAWATRGGVFIPIYQSEALWLHFKGSYPCAVKIAAGKINAVSGEAWRNELSFRGQDYVVVPSQSWLDGFNVSEGLIRQFVAMPLGQGFTAEEQITGRAEHGGIQIIVYPMKREIYAERFEWPHTVQEENIRYGVPPRRSHGMGFAPGGSMRQGIYEDPYGLYAWDQMRGSRCFIHLMNSAEYHAVTGERPPHEPPDARSYAAAGLPWFDRYDEGKALAGSDALERLASVTERNADTDPSVDALQAENAEVLSVRSGKERKRTWPPPA